MTEPPEHPKIYHITHVDNLKAIVRDGALVSDASISAWGGPSATIGISSIKRSRLTLPVDCHPGAHVGDFVPFYFCPRSVMLFVLHCNNAEGLTYHGGQEPIVHLEADFHEIVDWADANGRRWAFSLSNAGAAYAEFRAARADLHEIDWAAVGSRDFSGERKEGKQAEFLVQDSFPWSLVRRIGVHSESMVGHVVEAIATALHQPPIEVRPEWYFSPR